jgi:hypothetical protein
MIGFIDTLFTQFGNTVNATLSLIPHFTLHHYTRTGSSFFTSRILTTALSLQTTHEVLFLQPNSLLAISSHYPWTANSRTDPVLDNNSLKWNLLQLNSLNSWQQLKRPFSFYYSSARTTQKTQPLCCWEGLFTDPLSSNIRPIFMRFCFRVNMFTESLPSNGYVCHSMFFAVE